MSRNLRLQPRVDRIIAALTLLVLLLIEVELFRRFRRAHNPGELLTLTGLMGGLLGATVGALLPRDIEARFIFAFYGAVIGVNMGWLTLLVAGVIQLFQLGVL